MPKPKKQKRTEVLYVRLTPADRKELRRQAKENEVSEAAWVADMIRRNSHVVDEEGAE